MYVDFDRTHVVYTLLLSHHQMIIMERLSYVMLLNSEDMEVCVFVPSLAKLPFVCKHD
jgi:hypothetical protein